MKKLAIIAFAAVSTFAFAGASQDESSPEINISGVSLQSTSTSAFSTLSNKADEEAYAVQNVSSNAGNVTISGASTQNTSLGFGAVVQNHASGKDAYAAQNLASNSGLVSIAGASIQLASVNGWVSNEAEARATAVQNVSSNNGCSACAPDSDMKPGYGHGR